MVMAPPVGFEQGTNGDISTDQSTGPALPLFFILMTATLKFLEEELGPKHV
jgi:hypothetical protein